MGCFFWFRGSRTTMLRTSFRRLAGRSSLRRAIRLESTAAAVKPAVAAKASSNTLLIGAGLLSLGFGSGYFLASLQDFADPPEDVFPISSTTKLDLIDAPVYANDAALKLGFTKIEKIVGKDNFTYDKQDFANYDVAEQVKASGEGKEKSDLIVYPRSAQQISEILFVAHEFRIPVFPIAGNTSVQGQRTVGQNGLVLDLQNLDAITEFNEDDLQVTVQPGTNWADLNDFLESKGYFFAPTPGPGAAVGGIINTNASSVNASKYGTVKDNVVNLTVVLADGTIVKTKKSAPKSSAGYNLNEFFIGSEGTLGVVADATFKVHPILKNQRVNVSSFSSLKDATNTISELFKQGLKPEQVQLLDTNLITALNDTMLKNDKIDPNPTLFIKLTDNDDNVLHYQLKQVEQISKSNNSVSSKSSKNAETSKALWKPVNLSYPASFKFAGPKVKKGALYHSFDVAVPVSSLAELIEETNKQIEIINKNGAENNVYLGGLARAGSGNYLPIIIYDPSKKEEVVQLDKAIQKKALELNGTISGQYGIGLVKKDLLPEEVGADGVDLQRKLKLAVDPLRILNPGKIFDVSSK